MNTPNDVRQKNSTRFVVSVSGSRKGRYAFTLVELLVVVAIIALLVSILLPTLGKAKEQARMVMCMSNLKGLGLGYILYTSENSDWYPQSCARGGGDAQPQWDGVLQPYYGNHGLLHCPSDPPNGAPACGYTRRWMWDNYYGTPEEDRHARSFAMNACVCGAGPSQYFPNYLSEVHKTSYVTDPGDTIVLSECWYWSFFIGGDLYPGCYNCYSVSHTTTGDVWDPGSRGPTADVHRNNDAANYLFCDGHVVTLSQDDPNLAEADDYYYFKHEK